MFTRMLAVFSVSLIIADITESTPALAKASRQLLTGNPGYIPVYIRPGETPLEDINAELAEAFNFYAQKNNRINFGRFIGDKSDSVPVKGSVSETTKFSDIDKVSLEEDLNIDEDDNETHETQTPKTQTTYSYIQKIPRS